MSASINLNISTPYGTLALSCPSEALTTILAAPITKPVVTAFAISLGLAIGGAATYLVLRPRNVPNIDN